MQQRFWVLKNLCSELSLSKPTMTAKEVEGVLTTHQSRDGGEDQDGQHRHIIGPSWIFSQQAIPALNRVYKMYMN
jgi:hypothetical protein